MRSLLAAAGLLLFACGQALAIKPTVVVIVTDDMAQWHMQAMPRTQALLGAQGVTYTLGMTPDPLCGPSRTSFFLGQYSHSHGIVCNPPPGGWTGWVRQGLAAKAFPALLHNAGYRTGLFGKFMNEAPDNVRLPGFDRWVMCHQGTCDEGYNYRLIKDGKIFQRTKANGLFVTDEIRDDALDFIRKTPADQPLFLYFAPGAPHAPASFANRHASLFPAARCPRTPAFNEADTSDLPEFLQMPALDQTEIDALDFRCRKQLRALASVDEAVEDIVQALQQSGRLPQAWIFFWGDNGYHMGDHRVTEGKNLLWKTDLMVPFIVRGPLVERGVIDNEHLVTNSDLMPTILTIAGIPVPSGVDGRTLHRIARGQQPDVSWRNVVPTQRSGGASGAERDGNLPDAIGVKTLHYTFSTWADGECELYDDTADPHQLTNRCNDPALAGVQEQLSSLNTRLHNAHGGALRAIEREDVP